MTSARNIPIAAPTPPTHGPNSTLKTAGAKTCGQNLTPKIITGKIVHKAPIPAYKAAFTAVNVNCSDKEFDRFNRNRYASHLTLYSNLVLFDWRLI
jgi:hypothetical protein